MQWRYDCQGKEDYDGALISASCRFYPGKDSGHGGMTTHLDARGKVTIGTLAYGDKPSALCSIFLNLDPGGDSYVVWREASITADTDAEVKRQVEAWVQQQRETLRRLLGLLDAKVQP